MGKDRPNGNEEDARIVDNLTETINQCRNRMDSLEKALDSKESESRGWSLLTAAARKNSNVRPLSEWLEISRDQQEKLREEQKFGNRNTTPGVDPALQMAERTTNQITGRKRLRQEQSFIRIMSLNVNGLRKRRKILALGKYIASLEPQPDICLLTEAHLFEHELKRVQIDTYVQAHNSCRKESDVQQACGGVLILIKKGPRYFKQDDLPELLPPLNGCSVQISPANPQVPALRITGAYIQPAAKPKFHEVGYLTGKGTENYYEGKKVGRILGGDFNPLSWNKGFEQRIGEHGI